MVDAFTTSVSFILYELGTEKYFNTCYLEENNIAIPSFSYSVKIQLKNNEVYYKNSEFWDIRYMCLPIRPYLGESVRENTKKAGIIFKEVSLT